MDSPELNLGLDSAAFADAFARAQRVHIPAVLATGSAERLLHALTQETPWALSHNTDGTPKVVRNLAPADRMRLALESCRRARSHYAFFHDSHPLSREGEPYARPDHVFAGLVTFLNGPEFLGFIRRVTGLARIARANAEATLFRPGDYVTRQDGTAKDKNRLAGYVLWMTPAWRLDWGGALEFLGGNGHIAKGYVPTFNTLTVFAVPRPHFVSQVALHGGLRYAVSGWLRSDLR